MPLYNNLKAFQECIQQTPHSQLGLVPTMGNLHQGHLELARKSLSQNDLTVVTIFVNPTQFGEGEDFGSYPRTLDEDFSKLKELSQDIIVLAPDKVQEIYPADQDISLKAPPMAQYLEGNVRPTHFDGVVTVVNRLFQLIPAHNAYFGKKDYQQLRIIQSMARELHPKINIVPVDTVREKTLLAMSSRNNYLTSDDKEQALKLYTSLSYIEKILLETRDLTRAQSEIQNILANDERFNYLSIRNQHTLEPPLSLNEPLVILGNFQLGSTRLLDNIEVNLP